MKHVCERGRPKEGFRFGWLSGFNEWYWDNPYISSRSCLSICLSVCLERSVN